VNEDLQQQFAEDAHPHILAGAGESIGALEGSPVTVDVRHTRWPVVVFWAILPVSALLIFNVVLVELNRPRGPFGEGEERMERLNNGLNYVAAEVFQSILVVVLLVIGGVLLGARRRWIPSPVSTILAVVLGVIYAITAVCAVELVREAPAFGLLAALGVVIIGLSCTAFALAVVVSSHADTPRMLSPATSSQGGAD
jgi:hypothetical protein